MSDTTILYQGGSGGFVLYYYLLLSGEYQFDIPTVQQMIVQQFPRELASMPNKWKATELWPNNIELKKTRGKKLFLICNPLFNSDMLVTNLSVSSGTHKILLYANIHLQLRMAWDKKAYWFTDISRQQFNAPLSDRKYMRDILNTSVDFCGTLVDPVIPNIVNTFSPAQVISLQNFINGELPVTNSYQSAFIEYWSSLQPAKAIRQLTN